MSNLSHYFVAIPLPECLEDYLSKWQHVFKEKLSYKIWPHHEDLHITLKFLGPVEAADLERLQYELQIIEQFSTFELKIGTIGTFGNPYQPRIIWAGVEKNENLIKLQQAVEECAVRIGFAKETREYKPHITLAKKLAGKIAEQSLEEMKKNNIEPKQMQVNEVVIYQIFPNRNPKYEIVKMYTLSKN